MISSYPSMRRRMRQSAIGDWCINAFGKAHALNVTQRGIRSFEEGAELAQAAGVDREMAHRLVNYVWDRPAGTLAQEVGGVAVTTLALCAAAHLDVDQCELDEVTRVLNKPIEHFQRRNAEKNAAGFEVGGVR